MRSTEKRRGDPPSRIAPLKVTRCSAEHRTTSLSSWVPLSFSECIRSWQRRRPEGRRRLQPIRFLGLASTLLAEPRRLPRSRRSLGTARPKAGSADHLSRLAEASPTSDVRLSRLGRRSLRASQLPTLSPRSASAPEGPSARLGRGRALSDTPHRRGHLPSRVPEGPRGSSAQTPVIVFDLALRSRELEPLSSLEVLALVRPGGSLPGRLPRVRFGPSALDHARPHRGQLG